MDAIDVLKAVFEKEGIVGTKLSAAMGKSKNYISAVMSRGSDPHCETMATILDAVNYDLIARSRDDGFEFTIAPPDDLTT